MATLAEVAAETIVAPWVIENEVNLNYQATVTVKHDPDDATWPATASSWTLETKLDDAPASNALTGDINAGGRVQSDPGALHGHRPVRRRHHPVEPRGAGRGRPPGGHRRLAQVHQRRPEQPADHGEFAITELPATDRRQHRLRARRHVSSTATRPAATPGSTGSRPTAPGRAAPIQEVTGVTVVDHARAWWAWSGSRMTATTCGVCRWTRTATPSRLSAGPKEGYARPPFLLFDAFVGRQDRGNHVLLEPDDTSDAYFVRQVTLDPDTGGITWDSSTALGTFSLPVSGGGAALVGSGRRRAHRQRPRGPAAPGGHAAAGPGRLQRRHRHPDRAAAVADGGGRDQPRHRASSWKPARPNYPPSTWRATRSSTSGRTRTSSPRSWPTPARTRTWPSTAPARSTCCTTPATARSPTTTTSTSTRRRASRSLPRALG